ncbi:ribokinase [Marisediminicola senii]|uniref:ribokinase n=1 Tax=Marisediminicola senii TaxID=2711233 RepID=UPI0013EB262A|nr:ribokinase [Marisediminicola senii]
MNSAHSGVAVVGSANMDTVFTVDRAPAPGETVLATTSALYAGGKGLNQAVAAARAGAATAFVAALGRDGHGDALAAVIDSDGIDDRLVRRVDDATGQAFIVVSASGDNSIVVASGANATVGELTEGDRAAIAAASVLLMQLELPMPVVIEAARHAAAVGTTVVLNAAPARGLPDALLALLDCLIVNEHEATVVAGVDDVAAAGQQLAALVDTVIVTLGADGSAIYEGGGSSGTGAARASGTGGTPTRIAAPAVAAVDTTGAGDTFCGAFCAAVAGGMGRVDAARFATAAAALSVQAVGAVPSIPRLAEIERQLDAGSAS